MLPISRLINWAKKSGKLGMSPIPREGELVAIRSKIIQGGFSSERIFEVKLADNTSYRSVAPCHFFWKDQRSLLSEDELTDELEDGLVAARFIDYVDDNQWIVEVPDGEAIAVDEKDVRGCPTPIIPPRPSR